MKINISSNNNAADYFWQGHAFAEAARRCLGPEESGKYKCIENGVIHWLPAPCVVNASFACEMFIKSMLRSFEIPYNKLKDRHDLYELYSLLTKEVTFCDSIMTSECFKKFLSAHRNDFKDLRYFIERNGYTQLDPNSVLTMTVNLEEFTYKLLYPTHSKNEVTTECQD